MIQSCVFGGSITAGSPITRPTMFRVAAWPYQISAYRPRPNSGSMSVTAWMQLCPFPVRAASPRESMHWYPTRPESRNSFCTRNRWANPCHTSYRSEEHTSELQSHSDLVCRLLLEKKKKHKHTRTQTTNRE